MKSTPTSLPEVLLLEPDVHGDERGWFMESWNRRTFLSLGLDIDFVQDNHSRSTQGVLRGIHYQLRHPQGKLVRVTRGAAYDVALDMRRSSPHFGRWTAVELSAQNHRLLWIPPGFGHGFLCLTPDVEFQYKVTAPYDPESERGVRWDALDIPWPLEGLPLLSARDQRWPDLTGAESYP
ncbi:MAG: dTDP-4-dehydrorhamnose 3,5-epimerase [Betaproteobacteria bacterium]|nr:dTDP-4-dehydrorhamnose 3,5-epimerase [Betaproteobacteria bacterium]